ncbi:MAG: hypothetical protein PSX80_12920 [bacterium]|nr:hypothetical protein [bacterium]
MNDTPQFGKLVEADIREAWKHEAHMFTPWLYENLNSLGEAIGMKLEGEGSEVAVDTFSADILARDPTTDTKVLIENQLAGSDHSHLGQIMTYLAGLDAKTIIWVATDFRPAHLSALKWLNEHTEEGFSFFAVKVKVVRIGDSPFAPIFEVMERPNEWERHLHAATANTKERSELSERRFTFWQAFVQGVPEAEVRDGPASYLSNRWRVLDDVGLVISLMLAKRSVGIFIRTAQDGSNEETAERLRQREADLSMRLGVPFGNSDRYFFFDGLEADYTDPARQPNLIDWLAAKADLYETTLREVFGDE